MNIFTINKTIDLINNDGLCVISNHAAQQHHNAINLFYDFISEIKPKKIIEIGTALGGFTALLGLCKQNLNLNTDIFSYDIINHPWYNELINYGVISNTHNIFNENYDTLIDTTVADTIRSDGVTLVLCDGGCKKCEFNILSQYLKNNDIIMTHDYAPNKQYFNINMNLKIWNWHEIEDNDIIDSINKYNLVKHEWYDKFLNVAWGCFVKE